VTPPERGFPIFLQIVTAGTSSDVTPAPIHNLTPAKPHQRRRFGAADQNVFGSHLLRVYLPNG
jgi:hypothetical protein